MLNEDIKNLEEVRKVFFEDPRWSYVEKIIKEYVEPLLDMTTIDTSQPAEAVKAEIVGRTIAYNKLTEFLQQSKLVGAEKRIIKSAFK